MKEFYFIRHGQTDYNIRIDHDKVDHPPHIPLNDHGRKQAMLVEPVIAALPIKTICCSPYLRAQETKHLISSKLQVEHLDVEDLGECNAEIWTAMFNRLEAAVVDEFHQKVKKGLDAALAVEGPVLIVAHGGVHWAICSLLNIVDHEYAIDNCVPVHFTKDAQGIWKAKVLV